jgi:hypothetical protein
MFANVIINKRRQKGKLPIAERNRDFFELQAARIMDTILANKETGES